MSGDGTTDRGAKPPRTLFSLGRPGPKAGTAEAAPESTAESGVVADDGLATDEVVELACGACGATLLAHAAFCGECGTPVAQLDDEPFDLVEEVPMADLEDADFGEYVEELPIDDAPAVLYSDAAPVVDAPVADHPTVDGAGATVMAQPAAVLYADPSQAEPLPPAPTGSFAISEPSYGNSDGAIEVSDDGADGPVDGTAVAAADTSETPAVEDGATTEQRDDTDDGIGAAPLVAGAAVVGAAVIGSELAASAAEDGAAAASDADVLAGLAPTDVVADGEGVAAAESAASPWADAPADDAPAAEASPTDAPASDAPTADTSTGDAPTAVEPAVVLPIAGAAAMSDAGAPTAPVAAASYGTTPPASGGGKSKTGLLIGVAAAVVLVLIVGGIIIASSGNKDGAVQTAQQATTTAAPSTTTTAPSSTTEGPTTSAVATTAPSSTTNPSTTDTTAVTITTVATTPVPTTPRVTVTQTPTTPAIQPGRIVASPPAGSPTVLIPKGGSFQIQLENVGGTAAGCALTGSNGISVSQNCSPSIQPGTRVTVTVTASAGYEGAATVTGVLEGSGNYLLSVSVQNG